MSIVVTGAYGQLGGELSRQLGAKAIPLDIDTLDLTDRRAVLDMMLGLKPEAIVNCAAYTQVDKAESEPALCRAVNAAAVEHLAAACAELDCPLVQISTDYLFGGVRPEPCPWRENETLFPRGFTHKRSWKANGPLRGTPNIWLSAPVGCTPERRTGGRRTL